MSEYSKKTGKVFDQLGTTAKDWRVSNYEFVFCESMLTKPIQGYFKWNLPEGYARAVTEYSYDNLYEKFMIRAKKACTLKDGSWDAQTFSNMLRRFNEYDYCELCGHWIVEHCYIQCDSKKLILCVGNECVNSFVLAESGVTIQELKKQLKDKVCQETIKVSFDNVCKKLDYALAAFNYSWMPRPLWDYNMMKKKGQLENAKFRKMFNFLKKYSSISRQMVIEAEGEWIKKNCQPLGA